MPSPFPGMDPYLEGAEWEDFHTRLNMAMSAALTTAVRPKYMVRGARRVYLDDGGEAERTRVPDGLISGDPATPGAVVATAAALSPAVVAVLPQPVRRRETYLVIREVPGREVVTVIETLSPANKRRNSAGRAVYLRKRDELLDGPAHFVELDLLRGGDPMPVAGTLPPHAFSAVVSEAPDRPRCTFYPAQLNGPLPMIGVPLREGDGPVALDLQAVFERAFGEVAYDDVLEYATQPPIPFAPAEAAFARTLPGVLTDAPAGR